MRFVTLLTFLLIFITTTAFVSGPSDTTMSDMAQPVRWSFDSEQVDEHTYKVFITARISEGWYMYSKNLKLKSPIPTSVRINQNDNIQLVGTIEEIPFKQKIVMSQDGSKLIKVLDRATYVQEIHVEDPFQSVTGDLRFMVCNGVKCLPPQDITFEVILEDE